MNPDAYTTTHALTFTQAHTIADALIAYALQTDSTDERIRNVIDALRAINYEGTASVLDRLQNDSSSVMRERIEAYTRRAG